MRKLFHGWILLLAILTLILVIFFTINSRINENPVYLKTHLFTKAICDKDNFCQDFEVECKNENVIRITPTGFGIQKPIDWKDPRTPGEIERLCD